MNLRLALYLVGILNLFLSLAMIAPLLVALIYSDGTAVYFIEAILITIASALLMILTCRRRSNGEIRHREGMAVVALGWFSAALFGGLLVLCGCDAELQAVIESGIIDTSTSVLTSFLQALIQLASEAAATT